MKNILIIIITVFISGCAMKNTGKIDYRKSIGSSNVACSQNCTEYDKRFVQLDSKDITLGKENRFVPTKDRVSLHLKTAYIKTYTEIITNDKYFSRGEIAIVANAFEIGKQKNSSYKELSFSDLKEGRVVFYDDDVMEGQTLNFNNMPIYGPTVYKGNPLAFRISILELDSGSQYSKTIMNTLADVGSKAYPQSSPILNLLNSLGSVFFSGDSSDYEFRYTMHFDADGGMDNMNHTYLEAGYYVFVKKRNRNEFVDWSNLSLNTNDFLLYKKDKNNKFIEKYTDETYVVIEINKNLGNVDVELESNNLTALQNSLESLTDEQVNNFQVIKDSLINVAKDKYYKENLAKAKQIIDGLVNNGSMNEQTKKYKANKFIEMIGKSVKDDGSALDSADDAQMLYYSDIEYLLENISGYLVDVSLSDYSKSKFAKALKDETLKDKLITLLLNMKK